MEYAQTTPSYPPPVEGDYKAKDFHFASGETLPELNLHYATIGIPHKDLNGKVDNAILIMHGTTGSHENFLNERFGGRLFGDGQLLDAKKYFLILPDAIGHGQSGKPNDGLHMKFPKYTYDDRVKGDYILVTEHLHIDHLRLVMGTSMGAMHTWVWGYTYPDFMDALMPGASLPAEIAGRNRMMRKMAIDASRYYNPSTHLSAIRAPLFAVNSADEEVNPPELGIMKKEIKSVNNGRYILLPITDQTAGHGTHSNPAIWGGYLKELLAISEKK